MSIPMQITLVAAVIAVKSKDVANLNDFVELDEPLYGLVFLWLFFTGPGPVSLDNLIVRAFRGRAINGESTRLRGA